MKAKICAFLLLILGLALPAQSSKCPGTDKLPANCDCEDESMDDEVDVELLCTGATLDELNDALRQLDTSHRLGIYLGDMNLQTLPSRVFDGWNVVKLDLSHCDLDSLGPQGQLALAGLEDTLEVISIVSSFTEDNQLTKIDLSHLRRLTELELSYNAITEVSDDWFANGPTSLTALSLSNNGIEKIGDRAFANLVNLDKLELHGNRFGPIKRSMLPSPANRLEVLEFDNNAFTSVPDDLFSGMPALKDLSLRMNGIAHLQEKAFKPIWSQLDRFDARGNSLECDSTMEWLFDVSTNAVILGKCDGPEGRSGMGLKTFIESRGQ